MVDLDLLLRQYPLIVTTGAFLFGALRRDLIWLIAFIGSILSMLANRGIKRLAMKVVEWYPETASILNRPGKDSPGMVSGHAQIAAAFLTFTILWLYYYNRQAPLAFGGWILAAIAILGIVVMENSYIKEEHTKLQIILGSMLGAFFGTFPYYFTKWFSYTSNRWLPDGPDRGTLIAMIILPALLFVMADFVRQTIEDAQQTNKELHN